MHTTIANNKVVYCVGSKEDYTSLLCCGKLDEFEEMNIKYLGKRIDENSVSLSCVLLMNLDIDNIAYCIVHKIEHLLFFYNQLIITEEDSEIILDYLEDEYLKKADYSKIKQTNIIRLVFEIRRKETILKSKPIHLQIEHTTFCNARCIMCDHYIAHNRNSKHLKLSTLQSIESLLPFVSTVIMHGNGEPLLNPDIIKIFDLYKKYHVKTSLNTNLSFVDEDILSAIRDNCISIHVSCDGSNEKQYESIRQGLSYSTFKSNLKKLSISCPGVEKVLEVVLMRQNIRNTEQFVWLAYDHGFNKVIFNSLGCNKWIGNDEDGLHNYTFTANYYCHTAKELGKRLEIHVITPFDNNTLLIKKDLLDINGRHPSIKDSDFLYKKYPWYTNVIAFERINRYDLSCINPLKITDRYEGICEYPFAKSYINLSGRVSFCCSTSRKIVDIVSFEKSFDEIWNGTEYQKLRETFYCGELPQICSDCCFIKNNSLKFLSWNQKKGDGE